MAFRPNLSSAFFTNKDSLEPGHAHSFMAAFAPWAKLWLRLYGVQSLQKKFADHSSREIIALSGLKELLFSKRKRGRL